MHKNSNTHTEKRYTQHKISWRNRNYRDASHATQTIMTQKKEGGKQYTTQKQNVISSWILINTTVKTLALQQPSWVDEVDNITSSTPISRYKTSPI